MAFLNHRHLAIQLEFVPLYLLVLLWLGFLTGSLAVDTLLLLYAPIDLANPCAPFEILLSPLDMLEHLL